MRFVVLLFLWSFCLKGAFGQIVLSGKILNESLEPVPYINILIYPTDSSVIIAYSISDLEGKFSVKVQHLEDSIRVETSAIHYKKEKRVIANRSQEIQFVLKNDVKALETFTVRASPIERRGDTLSYLVGSFTEKSDRSIADVLRRMPGIEVEPSGQILYQGLPIQKFYIEGLDLMDSRYAMVSNNMPHQSVATVEVLENHQPIRILEEKVISHQASLNLKLKNNIISTGKAHIGAGMSPVLWDANITPMTFTRNLQFLASYQTNNIGKDISAQLNSHAVYDPRKSMQPNDMPDILNVQTVSPPPDFAPSRYLNNAVHLANINALAKLNNSFQLRANVFYINDFQRQEANASHAIYTAEDTVIFHEKVNNSLLNNYLQAVVTLSKNVKTNYFENKLSIKTNQSYGLGQLIRNTEQIEQTLEKPIKSISNEFHSIIPMGKKLLDVSSHIAFNNSPHQLLINPGVFPSLLNDGQGYETLLQSLKTRGFFTENSIGLFYEFKGFVITQRTGFAIHNQKLFSSIEIDGRAASTDFENNQNTFNAQTYLQTEAQYRKKSFTFKLNLPIVYQSLRIEDRISDQGQSLNRLFFRPRLFVQYKFKGFWEASATWSHSNNYGNIDGINYAYILKSYRYLSQNNAAVDVNSRNIFGFQLKHSNAITSFFNSLAFQYVNASSNLLYNNSLDGNGASIITAAYLPNHNQYVRLHINSSKYIPVLHCTFSIKAEASQQSGIMRVNDKTFDTRNRFYNLNPYFLYRFKHWLNIDYGIEFQYFQNYIAANKIVHTDMIKQNLNLYFYPKSNQMLSLSFEYYEYKNEKDYFMDFVYRYTLTKSKIDLELKWLNIFNSTFYTTYQVFSNSIIESTYLLNPNRILISVSFGF
ncbi:MAG: hypothetical protein CVT92_04335 [Bacteroidetes bacterium HGW-Bacteroidetes-1]|jgi:hypothetical protein|nr:MAG: hypothetical protein CVT92_04335 [Bacteroidetes bacterium HGW-Bacteroidetes-1]